MTLKIFITFHDHVYQPNWHKLVEFGVISQLIPSQLLMIFNVLLMMKVRVNGWESRVFNVKMGSTSGLVSQPAAVHHRARGFAWSFH